MGRGLMSLLMLVQDVLWRGGGSYMYSTLGGDKTESSLVPKVA